MTDKPSEDEEKAAEAEFQRVLGYLARMPPKPHAAPKRPLEAPEGRNVSAPLPKQR